MQAKIGIPDDSPENTVKVIEIIAQEVASELGGTCVVHEREFQRLSTKENVDITVGERTLRIHLNYVEFQNLACVSGSIGNGDIYPVQTETGETIGEHWKLELICWEPCTEPPYVWGLFPSDVSSPLDEKPVHILDGSLLRYLIRERLQPQLRE
jgi:hypothetical protein